ncbi:hypothetical protein KJ359_012160 [Pestalotiopsis sp. 9143b]|nr:hypothetical protein KJ359_012160 [Pestalotiopsis sp. 9143b]
MGRITSRADTMSIGMGAKSLAFIAYQFLTQHVNSLKRWGSLKANSILNFMDIIFWAAVVYLMAQSDARSCPVATCTLSKLVLALGVILSVVSCYTFLASFILFKESRASYKDTVSVHSGNTDIENGRYDMSQSGQQSLNPYNGTPYSMTPSREPSPSPSPSPYGPSHSPDPYNTGYYGQQVPPAYHSHLSADTTYNGRGNGA